MSEVDAARSAKIILSLLQEIMDVCRQILVGGPSPASSEHISDGKSMVS